MSGKMEKRFPPYQGREPYLYFCFSAADRKRVRPLLERMYAGTLLGRADDDRMLGILLNQRLNGKLPFYLHGEGVKCAHKTGEDDGITHDAGIVYSRKPFVICMLSNEVDVPAFERLMQDTARELALNDPSIAKG